MFGIGDIFNLKNWVVFLLAYLSVLFLMFFISCIRGNDNVDAVKMMMTRVTA